jgi:hypothetical protein
MVFVRSSPQRAAHAERTRDSIRPRCSTENEPILSEAFVGEPFFIAGIQLGRFACEARSGEAPEFVLERSLSRLASVPKSPSPHEFIDSLQQRTIERDRDFRFGHGGMTNHHTKVDMDVTSRPRFAARPLLG